MIAEILTIGDELLRGSRVDTNAAFVARKLDEIGIEVRYKSTAADDMDRLEEAIGLALRRADIIITTGGLGPTDDDITKKAICKVFKRNLIFHENILTELENRFAARGLKMPSINQNQALLPQGATFLANRTGSALGIVIDEHGKFFCSMPGVPAEMETMTVEELIPQLRERSGDRVIVRHLLRTVGVPESVLAEKFRSGLKLPEGVSLAYLPAYGKVDLAIKGTGTVREEVRAAVSQTAGTIRTLAGDAVFTEDDRELEAVIGDMLVEKGLTLAVAESCTGGLLGGRITRVPGSSRYFLGGVIAYANDIKVGFLKVPTGTLDSFGAVSAETAEAMAAGVRQLTGASIGVAVTGVAGPDGGTEDKPVGMVFIGLATDKETLSRKLLLGGDREIVRERTVLAALDMVRRAVAQL
ncbi:MAG: competence/damage-inducible protein A [candidate division Zixibacteria bacterium]|nr:competence/damage-inducible protein A [candidate division Zixibacteria bacterium]